MMTIIEDVAGKVTALLKKYEFDASTLARYLGLSLEQVNDIAHGKMGSLLEQRKVLDKIMFLYAVTSEDTDLKASAFLEVLVSHHHLSPTAVAKMAGADVGDVEKMLSGLSAEVGIHAKYKIAVTAMALRFFLKDFEPTI